MKEKEESLFSGKENVDSFLFLNVNLSSFLITYIYVPSQLLPQNQRMFQGQSGDKFYQAAAQNYHHLLHQKRCLDFYIKVD
jgi:hypothetical protein